LLAELGVEARVSAAVEGWLTELEGEHAGGHVPAATGGREEVVRGR
jgi:hypothetical protein